MLSSKFLRIGVHILGWLLFFSLIISFLRVSSDAQQGWNRIFNGHYLFFFMLYPALFYLNEYFLLPKLYLQKNYTYYFFIVGLLFLAIFFLRPFDHLMEHKYGPDAQQAGRRPPPFADSKGPPRFSNNHRDFPFKPKPARSGPHKIDIISLILFLMTLSLSTALRITRQWRLTEKRAAQAEADKANAELSF